MVDNVPLPTAADVVIMAEAAPLMVDKAPLPNAASMGNGLMAHSSRRRWFIVDDAVAIRNRAAPFAPDKTPVPNAAEMRTAWWREDASVLPNVATVVERMKSAW